MPIYEFYCRDCHTLFNFFSKTVNTKKRPNCPKCKTKPLTRQMSSFAFTGRAIENETMDDFPMDEGKMEKAINMIAGKAEQPIEDDPRQAADLMREITHMTGMQMGESMEEALARLEKGEDPEKIEADMGAVLESEDPFIMAGKKVKKGLKKRPEPERDETLYDL